MSLIIIQIYEIRLALEMNMNPFGHIVSIRPVTVHTHTTDNILHLRLQGCLTVARLKNKGNNGLLISSFWIESSVRIQIISFEVWMRMKNTVRSDR